MSEQKTVAGNQNETSPTFQDEPSGAPPPVDENLSVNLLRFNIFQRRKWDGITYAILYIVVPVFSTLVTLLNIQNTERALAYCYLTILISIANCIYDASGRWRKKQPFLNLKLTIIIVMNILIGLYCFFEFLMILVGGNFAYRFDWFLAFYLVAVIVAVFDFVLCFSGDFAIKTPVDKVAEREAVHS